MDTGMVILMTTAMLSMDTSSTNTDTDMRKITDILKVMDTLKVMEDTLPRITDMLQLLCINIMDTGMVMDMGIKDTGLLCMGLHIMGVVDSDTALDMDTA